MLTLNRVSAVGLGAGLVLAGCASPTDATTDDSTEQAPSQLAEANSDDGTATARATDEIAPLQAKQLAAALPVAETSTSAQLAPPPDSEDAQVASRSDAIVVGRWGNLVGVPYGYAFYGQAPVFGYYGGLPGYGYGLYRGVGWGRGYGYSYGCESGLGCAPGVWW